MKKQILYQNLTTFHHLTSSYFNENESVKDLYRLYPRIENFEKQIIAKQKNYAPETRKVIVKALKNQTENFEISSKTNENINKLEQENTFTITTGHQLNLCTGPVYFLYKIISVINLCETLEKEFPNYNFVPVFWMASEDHDIEEIRFFNYGNKKVSFESENKGAVGKISTKPVKSILENLNNLFPNTEKGVFLKELFTKAYSLNTLADATKFLVNELFGKKGIVILDGDDKNLKQIFVPIIKNELENEFVFNAIQNDFKDSKIKLQVNPRNINLFFLSENSRERIVFENNLYKINNTNLSFSKDEFLEILEKNPEKFSPNALFRPIYQEFILPNLNYIGGAAEIAYWLQLKSSFEAINLTFPMLMMRNSALIFTEKQAKKLEKLQIEPKDLLLSAQDLKNKLSTTFALQKIDFETQKQFLKDQFKSLYEIAKTTDVSFEKAIAAQEKKQIKGLENLEKKLKNAEKRKHENLFLQIETLQKELFQENTWQERHQNFSYFYANYGQSFIDKLFEEFEPLKQEFNFLVF